MKELVKAVFDVHKLPFKIVLWLAIVSGGALFLPAGLQAKFHLEKLLTSWGWCVGLMFLASAALVVINSIGWAIGGMQRRMKRGLWLQSLPKLIEHLDNSEKAVLREFEIQAKHVIELPIDNPTVVGLTDKGIIERLSNVGLEISAGRFFPCRIEHHAQLMLNHEILGFPREPTEADRERIVRLRPVFARELHRHNEIYGRDG